MTQNKNFNSNLSNVLFFIKKLDDRICTTHILDGQTRVPRWSLALNERRDLRVRPQSSPTHLQDCALVLGVLKRGAARVSGAALGTVTGQGSEVKLFQIITA